MHNLSKNVKVTKMIDYQAAGTGDTITSGYVDMTGFESVMFICSLGAIAAGGSATLKAQQDTDPAFGTVADLAGTGVANSADTDDNKLLILEIVKPQERYVRPAVVRAVGNVTIESVVAIQSGASYVPTTHDSTTVEASEVHVSPAEGVA